MTRTLRHWLAGISLVALATGVTVAQPRQPQPTAQPGLQPAKDDGVEVLARGPVHEAYAATVEYPTGGGPVVGKQPPEVIEELPPDQKPDGDNVQWIPGYWAYDDDRTDYIWISGFGGSPLPDAFGCPVAGAKCAVASSGSTDSGI